MVLVSQQTLTVGVHLGLESCQISLIHTGMLTGEVICKFCLNNHEAKRKGGNYVNIVLVYEILKKFTLRNRSYLREDLNWVAVHLA